MSEVKRVKSAKVEKAESTLEKILQVQPQYAEFSSGKLSWVDFLKTLSVEKTIRTAVPELLLSMLADLFAILEFKDLRVSPVNLFNA